MSGLTKEEHKALGIELRGMQHRLEMLIQLLSDRYGPANPAALRAEEAQVAIRNLIRRLLTQAVLTDFPDDPDPRMYY